MSGRIEFFGTSKEQTSNWSKNTKSRIKEAGVDLGKDVNENGGSGSVSYGYTIPTFEASDNSLYFLLNKSSNKKLGEFLYILNRWVLISGTSFIADMDLIANQAQSNYIAGELTSLIDASKHLLCFNINVNSSADTQIMESDISGGTSVDSVTIEDSYDDATKDRNHVSNFAIINAINGDEIELSNISNGDHTVQLHAIMELNGLDHITNITEYEHSIKADGAMGENKTFHLNGLHLIVCFESSGNSDVTMSTGISYSDTDKCSIETVYDTGVFACKAMIVDAELSKEINITWGNKSGFVSRGYYIFALS